MTLTDVVQRSVLNTQANGKWVDTDPLHVLGTVKVRYPLYPGVFLELEDGARANATNCL